MKSERNNEYHAACQLLMTYFNGNECDIEIDHLLSRLAVEHIKRQDLLPCRALKGLECDK